MGDYEGVLAALGRMIASAPEEKVMAVYNEFGKLVDPAVPKYLMGSVRESNAQDAYKALLEFKDVVKANPIAAKTPAAAANPNVDAAAGKLADASYAFIQDIDWSRDTPITGLKGLTGTPYQWTKAIDQALLKEAALAHVKAIGGMNAAGVAKKEDYQAILAGLGKAIASVPEGSTVKVYNAFGNLVDSRVPMYLMAGVKAEDAVQAYKGLMEFKDVVKAR